MPSNSQSLPLVKRDDQNVSKDSMVSSPSNLSSWKPKNYLDRSLARVYTLQSSRVTLDASSPSQHHVFTARNDSNVSPHNSTQTRGAVLVSASKSKSSSPSIGSNDGFWVQSSMSKSSQSPSTSHNKYELEDTSLFTNSKPIKTYSKASHKLSPQKSMSSFDRAALNAVKNSDSLNNPIAQLAMNSSVTVTTIPAPLNNASYSLPKLPNKPRTSSASSPRNSPVASGSYTSRKSLTSTPHSGQSSRKLSAAGSSRKLRFENCNDGGKVTDENNEDSDSDIFTVAPVKIRKLNRTPLKPMQKSSLLNGISPNKIEKAYGSIASVNPEKENVPYVKTEETIMPAHLLGFPNLGNTCYLNAVLQSLVSMRVFRLDVSSFVQRLPPPADSLLHGLACLLDSRRTGQPSSLRRPLRLIKENFEKCDSSFIGWKMQDANEFLTKVLDTIKDEVDKLLTEEIEKAQPQTPLTKHSLPFSPIKSNAPLLLNNSVVIRSLSPGEAAAAYKTNVSKRGLKRSLSSENLTLVNNAKCVSNDNLRLVVSDSEESSDLDGTPPRLKNPKNISDQNVSSDDIECIDDQKFPMLANKKVKYDRVLKSNKEKTPSYERNSHTNFISKPVGLKKSNGVITTEEKSKEENKSSNPITANFGFHLQEVYKCLGCSANVQRSQEYFSLYVHLSSSGCEEDDSQPSSIRAAVAAYMQQEQRELKCEHCAHPTALVTTSFTKMPRILIIQMKRYTYDAAEFSSLKVCTSIEVNKRLDLSAYTGSGVSRYPEISVHLSSAPPTPVKAPLTTAHSRVFGGARAEVLLSSGEPSTAEVFGCGTSDAAECATVSSSDEVNQDATETTPLTEDEQIQEALRRSLEEAEAEPGGSITASVDNVEDEEDDLQKAIRLSLQEAQERERITAEAEAAALAAVAAATEQELGREVPDEADECEGPHSYCLASIVSHYGRNTTAGHYVSDVLNEESNTWLHYDDETVTELPLSSVLGPSRQRNGYIFFYVHKDLLRAPTLQSGS
ncbi:ubiquitin carboxyl-terminal hydrolase 37 [Hyalella azteca]|uniref:Ubiquitin carboxyl-terminal hydrolase 37 n=1 Tax=Hyalella azteca TaxID=294128 RepID=A0A8B7NGZ6_HYAAZ|nr:ubiquitin carboxyl-terminal hydrolase 37 [Hyalella azteca]